jgi:hypothetical protein
MAILGYARVSTNGQTLEIQHEALRAAGCGKVYAEKLSGARADRPQLERLERPLGPGADASGQHGLLVFEEGIELALGYPGARSDLPRGRARIAPLHEGREGRRENSLANCLDGAAVLCHSRSP